MRGSAEYKMQNIRTWDEIAPRYHRRWAGASRGPWRSSDRVVEMTGIKRGDAVLDLACGTGVLTKKISGRVGGRGLVVGIDTSVGAIRIARRWNRQEGGGNTEFVCGDAERFGFARRFDVITCQYALFFFPDSQRVLKNAARNLKEGGVLGVVVHGSNTPYYSSITEVMTEFIPDYMPVGPARLDRFSTAGELKREIRRAGFRRVLVREFVFSFSPGTFDDYWGGYRRYVSAAVREKLRGLSVLQQRQVRRQVRERAAPYTRRGGRIVFPWQVLISTASPP